MFKNLHLNLAMFNKHGEVNFSLPPMLTIGETELNRTTKQIMPYLNHSTLSYSHYDLNLFKAEGFSENPAEWHHTLEKFLAQQHFKQASIDKWLHGVFYFIEAEFTEQDKETLSMLYQAVIPVHILLDLPEEQNHKVVSFLAQHYPYKISLPSQESGYDVLLCDVLRQFNHGLKSKIMISLSELVIQTMSQARQELKEMLARLGINLFSLMKEKTNFDDILEKEFNSLTASNRVEASAKNIMEYLDQFAHTFNIPVDHTIQQSIDLFFEQGNRIINNANPEHLLRDLEAKFKGNFGDNLLAIWKLLKFTFNVKEGIFTLLDKILFSPLIDMAEKLKITYQDNADMLPNEKNHLHPMLIEIK